MSYVIDFHTHPFLYPEDNICRYKDHCAMTAQGILPDLKAAGIDTGDASASGATL